MLNNASCEQTLTLNSSGKLCIQALFQISRMNTALGIGSYGILSFVSPTNHETSCTSCRWRHRPLTVRASRFYHLHTKHVPKCINRPWASNEYQPLSTNTELILTIVYLVIDPDSQRFKPLSHHIHWECRTKCARHHQSYFSFQDHIYIAHMIHHYFSDSNA